MMKKNKRVFLPVILWMLVIFCFSHLTGEKSSEQSGVLTELIIKLLELFVPAGILSEISMDSMTFLLRKTAHFIEYAILSFLSVRAFEKNAQSESRIKGWALSTVYGALDEIHQSFVPGRAMAITDIVIDSFGAVAGVVMYFVLNQILKSRRREPFEQ